VGAVSAAKEIAIRFCAVPNDAATAMRALWGKRLDGAFETIEGVMPPIHHHLEGLVIVVSARFAFSHFQTPFARLNSSQ